LVFGLLTETFAIVNNLSLPPEKRILLSPHPVLDLFYGLFYYLLLIVTWRFLIARYTYSKVEVFAITGLLGVMTEETGAVFVRIFTMPVMGFLYAVLVAFVYGIFPMLAYMVAEDRLPARSEPRRARRFVAAGLALFAQWVVFGLLVLPVLKGLVR
jgi:hypothetical protein